MFDPVSTKGLAEPNFLDLLETLEPGGSVTGAAAVDDENIYFGSGDCHIYSVNKKSGALNWKFRTGGFIGFAAPSVFNGVVYIGSFDNNLYALDCKSGELVWKFRTNGGIMITPCVMNDRIIFTSMDGFLYHIDSGGNLVWKRDLGKAITISPSVVNGNIYLGSWVERNIQCISMENKVLWKINVEHWPTNCVFATPDGKFLSDIRTGRNVEADEFVIVFGTWNNKLYLSDQDGNIIWKHDIKNKLAPMTIHNGNIFAGSFDRNIYSYSMKDASFNWKYPTGDIIIVNTPLVHDKALFTGSCDGNIYALNSKDGTLIWRFQTAGPVLAPPIISDDILYVGSWDSHMYAFDIKDMKNPTLLWKFSTGVPPSPPKFVNWIQDFEQFKEKYLTLGEWKPETITSGNEKQRSGYESPSGVGDYSAFSRVPYQGFGAPDAYKGRKGIYTEAQQKKKDGYG